MQNCTAVDDALHRHGGLETEGFVGQLLPQLMDLVRASKRLPVGEEHAIRRGSKEFLLASKELGQRSLSLVHRALRFLDGAAHQSTSPEDLSNFDAVVDSVDGILEAVDADLRRAAGGPSAAAGAGAASEEPALPRSRSGVETAAAGATKGAGQKPQARWRHLVDNQRTEFIPRILVKHNQRSPLDPRLVAAQRRAGLRPGEAADAAAATAAAAAAAAGSKPAKECGALERHLSDLGVGTTNGDSKLPHPYEDELAALSWPSSFFETRKPQTYARMEDTPLVVVSNVADLRQMIGEIKATCQGKEIAVDVEHHDFRSYRGFVCLVQISTRQKDYILDPFDIFEEMHELNEIFSDPGIVKVLHGADYDVKWLQRDFSVYLVNMFDTGQATRALALQGGYGLANLVQHCCNVKLDKKYQTADWRERPLPPDFLHYARCDTHYLLYCYDVLKNALLAHVPSQGIGSRLTPDAELQATDEGVVALQSVMDKSTALCRQQHLEAPLDAANTAMRLCERYSSKHRPLETKQFKVLQSLVQWRDRLARRLDESWNLVSPDACLWRIALALPASLSRLRSTCNPLPHTLQQHAHEVVQLVAGCTGGGAPPADAAPEPAPPLQPAAAPPEKVGPERAARAAEAEKRPEVREWPSKACCALRPVVHATVGGKSRHGSLEGLHAMLCALACADGVEKEGVGAVQELRRAIKFATDPPVAERKVEAKRDSSLAELGDPEQAAREAVPLGAEVEEVTLVQPTNVAPQPLAPPVDPTEMPLLAEAATGRRKRRRMQADSVLENVAKVAAAEADAAAEAPGAPPKKKKKRRPAQELGADPYL